MTGLERAIGGPVRVDATGESPAWAGALVERIDEVLVGLVRDAGLPGNLAEAVEYALLGPGKRVRPVLTLECCRACGGEVEEALVPAAAVEMIHAFSLVHDDLPALDDDDLRRGRPTTHKKFGEAMGVLVGDALMSLAFRVLSERLDDASLSGRMVRELARGTTAMIAGQVLDTLGGGAGEGDAEERLRRIHDQKTAALIRAACRMGAFAAVPEAEDGHELVGAMDRYGGALGLMFQVVDDLLDVEQSADHLGKRSGKDLEAGKLTYPGVLGAEASRAEVERLEGEALAALGPLGGRSERLAEICERLARRTR